MPRLIAPPYHDVVKRALPQHLITRTALLLVCALTCLGQILRAADTPKSIPELQAAIETVLKETRTPGVAIAIVRKDGPEWVAGLGVADVAAGTPATADTLFRIGSLSKGFVSLAMLKLQQEGRLSLQDTLRSRAPELAFNNPWEATHPVRLVHLLEHTAGWDDIALKDHLAVAPADFSIRQILDFNTKPMTSSWRPGSGYRYANSGPVAAAYVIEKVTGQRFEDYVSTSLFKPLAMPTASYFLTPEVERSLTKLYQYDGVTPAPYWHFLVRPAGAINASAKEMANYLQLLLNRGSFGGKQLFSPESIDRMETPGSSYAARDGMPDGYALGIQTLARGDRTYYGHYGSVIFGKAQLLYLPKQGVGFVFMINSGNDEAAYRLERLLCAYVTKDLPAVAEPPVAQVPAELLQDYAGWYEPVCAPDQTIAGFWRLMCLTELRPGTNGLALRNFVGPARYFVWYAALSERVYRRSWEKTPTLQLISDKSEGTQIQVSVYDHFHVLRRIPAALAWTQITVLVAALILIFSTCGFALVWVPRKIFGGLKDVQGLRVRVLPLVASLSLLAFAYAELSAQDDAINRLGLITPWSLGIFVLSLVFAASAFAGLVLALRHRKKPIHRCVWWHSFATSLVLTTVALYLAYWGWIGMRTWA